MFAIAHLAQMYGGHFHRSGWAHPWLVLLFLLFIGIAIGAAVWVLVRASRQAPHVHPSAPTDPALDILRMRFAQGEIDAAELAARAASLSGMRPPVPPQSGPAGS